jgi:HK97 family phage portal protein
MMANWLQQMAGNVGRALGTFERQRETARSPRRRPAFLDATTAEKRWTGGNLLAEGAQKRALRNSWVYTAVGMIAREVSSTEFQITRQAGYDAAPVQIANHPLEQLLSRPNPWMGRAYLWQYTASWLELSGNAYWVTTGTEIWPLPSHAVDVVPGDRDRFVDYYQYTANGQHFNIPAEYVVQFQLPNPWDIFRGLSPLAAALLAADSDNAMAHWNGTFFGKDNVMPSSIINLKSGDPNAPIDLADAQTLKSALRSDYQAARRKTAITTAPGGLDAVLLGWNPRDMDFIQGRQFTKEEIFAVYGVPGGLLDKNATEANATIADRIFKEKTIWPLLCLLAEQLTAQLVIPYYGADLRAGFADIRPANRALELQEVAAASPYLTKDEVRERYWQKPALPDGRGTQTAGTPTGDVPPEFFRQSYP